MRSPTIPPEAVILRTYDGLEEEGNAFIRDCYDLMLLVGDPGMSKSRVFARLIASHPETCHLIKGWTKPLAAYMECYWHRHKLLVFDDAEILWSTDGGKILMRGLTEHEDRKRLQWLSTAKELRESDVPTSFYTTSKVAFIMNEFVAGRDPFFRAIQDRGHMLYFAPPPLECHRYAASWFYDQQIHDFIGQHLHLVNRLSARVYNTVAWQKKAGHDWRQYFLDRYCLDNVLLLVQQLENNPTFPTTNEKVAEFIRLHGGCRKTYFNLKAKLKDTEQLVITPCPPIRVQGKAPQKSDRLAAVEAAQLEDKPTEEDTTGIGYKDAQEGKVDPIALHFALGRPV